VEQQYVCHVEITAAEELGVETQRQVLRRDRRIDWDMGRTTLRRCWRGGVGAAPVASPWGTSRDEKEKILSNDAPIAPDEVGSSKGWGGH